MTDNLPTGQQPAIIVIEKSKLTIEERIAEMKSIYKEARNIYEEHKRKGDEVTAVVSSRYAIQTLNDNAYCLLKEHPVLALPEFETVKEMADGLLDIQQTNPFFLNTDHLYLLRLIALHHSAENIPLHIGDFTW
jgi:hypothetical protein